mmetsp:Transcript_33510/g.61582  ORF Transcript_33510/g.61582 Transcript_33510/m.61582 type:complete len:218 (+) Transcript_33510:432-1085(+)
MACCPSVTANRRLYVKLLARRSLDQTGYGICARVLPEGGGWPGAAVVDALDHLLLLLNDLAQFGNLLHQILVGRRGAARLLALTCVSKDVANHHIGTQGVVVEQPRLNVMRNLKDGKDEEWDEDNVPAHQIMNKVEVLDKFAPREKTKLAHSSNAVVRSKPVSNEIAVLNEGSGAAGHQTNSNQNSNCAPDWVRHHVLHLAQQPPQGKENDNGGDHE